MEWRGFAVTPERWKEVEQLYMEAVDLEPGTRSQFLALACADEEFRREVARRVAIHLFCHILGYYHEGLASIEWGESLSNGLDEVLFLYPGYGPAVEMKRWLVEEIVHRRAVAAEQLQLAEERLLMADFAGCLDVLDGTGFTIRLTQGIELLQRSKIRVQQLLEADPGNRDAKLLLERIEKLEASLKIFEYKYETTGEDSQ